MKKTIASFIVVLIAITVFPLSYTFGQEKKDNPFTAKLVELSTAQIKDNKYTGALVDLIAHQKGVAKLNDLSTFVTANDQKVGFKYLHIVNKLPEGVNAKISNGSMEGISIKMGDKTYLTWQSTMALTLHNPTEGFVSITFDNPAQVRLLLLFEVEPQKVKTLTCAEVEAK